MAKKVQLNINPTSRAKSRLHARPKSRPKPASRAQSKLRPKSKPQRQRVKIRYLGVALVVLSLSLPIRYTTSNVVADSCPDVKILFARGSGSTRYDDKNYQTFKSALESKLSTTSLSYAFDDLDYPAVGVGINNFLVTLGALFGGGASYTFGKSINAGVENLTSEINSSSCPHTKYVIGGYSQGAIVVSKSLPQLNQDKLIYAATFGDPKIYLPEGKGPHPAACRGNNLSDYRMYVPDCGTYQGMLGGFVPYRPTSLAGKVGTWCNRHDFFCSPFLNMSQHSAYVSDNLYEDASKVIFDKIDQHFGLNSSIASPHDTAIVIDSTASMSSLINQYKAEALRLAHETLDSGGRVALYDYRDLKDPYKPVQHCDFQTCNLETFETELERITTGGGGDEKESLLSTSLHVMHTLNWRQGATKSLVVLTDADFLSPDRDGATFDQVVSLSKTIDPVNFYIITKPAQASAYAELAARTGGKVVTDMNELSLLTDYIMDRYDSLPRVEESDETIDLPTLAIDSVERLDGGTSARVRYHSDAPKAMVILNDAMLGITDQTTFTLTDLQPNHQNVLTLVPLTDELRGDPVSAVINDGASLDSASFGSGSAGTLSNLPKAPNTGVAQ